ncbi:hypothetical protein VFPFJ_05041 [Purpureocillium lilacinum]|uniref:Uncharacterized protein n=1 Tax=Purpureocillium lilacinum TaxID=33203 RepID=A0A179H3L3_PURLI|nr:hypothetical protein VFPFJ_05041 [Purpureocillium lilacinum]OAQ84091.1 hypothetical protein VFPBJ_02859 [Purpureocillium lilacinum]OAQ90882.1 hypothetical protein VFPFJ_05041 [Purpureocillium lilacinum]
MTPAASLALCSDCGKAPHGTVGWSIAHFLPLGFDRAAVLNFGSHRSQRIRQGRRQRGVVSGISAYAPAVDENFSR